MRHNWNELEMNWLWINGSPSGFSSSNDSNGSDGCDGNKSNCEEEVDVDWAISEGLSRLVIIDEPLNQL